MIGERASRAPRSGLIGRERLAADLRALRLQPGQNLLIHCSLRQLGRIDGGAGALLDAIMDVAGPAATLVVPTQTPLNSLSSSTFLAATAHLDAEERARFVAAIPAFDRVSTPSTGMGVFAEYVRTRPSASRSNHPQVSFAALGPAAHACVSDHDLNCHLGDRSPLGWLYRAEAAILLLGVGYSACTAFHLAEYRLPGVRSLRRYHCFAAEDGSRVEHGFSDIALEDGDFELLGADLDATPLVRRGPVGSAECRLLPLRAAVDFGSAWLGLRRRRLISKRSGISTFYRHGPLDTMVQAPVGQEVERTVPDDESLSTPFFLSYAHAEEGSLTAGAAHHSDLMAEQFFSDLSEDVGQLISLTMGAEIGFMDVGMRGGMQWTDELLHALGTCQVLIPLLSAPYLRSEWCGKEWYAFSRRSVNKREGRNATPRQGCIIPVIWAPFPYALLPSPVSEDMIFMPTSKPDSQLPAQYRENGIFGLLRMGREDSYHIIVWQLAMHVSKVYHSQQVEPQVFRLEDLHNIFESSGHD